tara:strand:+ start:77 stop:511 length:435 start_codon:yes stop_codon:yes gene_type:complete
MTNLSNSLVQWEKFYAPFSLGLEGTFRQLDRIVDTGAGMSYPPYNIRRISETEVVLEMALAGFTKDDVEVAVEKKQLSVTSRRKDYVQEGEYIHRGIALRSFSRSWQLGDNTEVGEVSLTNGMLSIPVSQVVSEDDKRKTLTIS